MQYSSLFNDILDTYQRYHSIHQSAFSLKTNRPQCEEVFNYLQKHHHNWQHSRSSTHRNSAIFERNYAARSAKWRLTLISNGH